MPLSLESLAAVATVLGTVLSLLALIQARNWLVMIGLPLIGVALIAGFYGRRERLALKSATITIEGRSIDALNAANLRHHISRTHTIQEIHHTAFIDGEDLRVEWTYSGYCRAKQSSAFEFTLTAESATPFDRLDCVAYDLTRDAAMMHPIRPLLVGSDGISKRLSVPFLEALKTHHPFTIMLKCTLPHAVKRGLSYYTLRLAFAQDRIPRATVKLIFSGTRPDWLRVYECVLYKEPRLVKTLNIQREEKGRFEYCDAIDNAPGQSARVYAFWRDSI
jgi:hypothetical protein